MKADYQSYQRAAGVALLGLAVQVVLFVLLLIYGLFARDHAALTASGLVGAWSLVWLMLAISFDLHRRERIEALEAEQFAASGAAGSSVFEGAASELRVAARRAAQMHKVWMPVSSLVLGVFLVAFGVWRLNSARPLVDPDNFHPPTLRGWAVALGLAIAFVGFVFARFVSGMSKRDVWANLKGGAAAAVGSALVGLSMAVAHFIDIAGPDVALRYIQVIFPVLVILLGGEVFLNFVLNIYRPRKSGELARPAFDSRVLGFLAAPDRIADSISGALSYQLGFDVSASWFYQLLSRSLALLILFGGLVVWLLTSLTMLQPHQTGRLLHFGSLVQADGDLGPGLHLKLPWPIQSVLIPIQEERDDRGRLIREQRTSTGVRQIQLGTRAPAEQGAILWTNDHAISEEYFLVQAGAAGNDPASAGRTADLVLLAVEVPLRYVVSDVRLFELLGEPQERDELLRAVGQRVVTAYLSGLTIDQLLGAQRAEISQELWRRVEAAFASLNPDATGTPLGAGVQIVFLGVQGAHPPQRVAGAFERVVQAQQRRQAALEAAKQASIRILATMAGSVDGAQRAADFLAQAQNLHTDTPDGQAERRELEQQAEDLLVASGGSAASALLTARADRWRAHMGTRARAELHNGQVDAFRASPLLFRTSLYFESMLSLMKGARLFVIGGDTKTLWQQLDLQDEARAAEIFTDPANNQ